MAEPVPTHEPLLSPERINPKEFSAVYGRIALSIRDGDNKIFDKNKKDIPTVAKEQFVTNLDSQHFDAADNASTRERQEQAKGKTAEQWIHEHVPIFKQNFHETEGFNEESAERWESFVCELFGVENQNQIDTSTVREFYNTYCGEKTDTGAFVKTLLQIYGGDFRQIESNRDVIQWISKAFGVQYGQLEIGLHHALVQERLQEKNVNEFIDEANATPAGETHSRINSPSEDKEAPICDYLYKGGAPLEIKPGKPTTPVPKGTEPGEPTATQTNERIDLDQLKDMNLNVAVQVLDVLRDRNMWQDNGENWRHQYGFDISKNREWFHLITAPDAKNSGAMNDVAQNRYQLPIAVYMPANHAMLVTKGPYKQGDGWYINVWNPFHSDTRPVKLQKNYDDMGKLEGNLVDDHLYVNRLFIDQQRNNPKENDLEALFNDSDIAPIREILRTAKLNELQQNTKDCIPLCMVTAAFLNALKKGDTPFKTSGINQMFTDYRVQILTRDEFLKRISIPQKGGTKELTETENPAVKTIAELLSTVKEPVNKDINLHYIDNPTYPFHLSKDQLQKLALLKKSFFVWHDGYAGFGIYSNPEVIPLADTLGKDPRLRAIEDLTYGDSGLLGLSGISAETPEKQASLYMGIVENILSLHEQDNLRSLMLWLAFQKIPFGKLPKNANIPDHIKCPLDIFIENDHEIKDGKRQLRPPHEVLLRYDAKGQPDYFSIEFTKEWQTRISALRDAIKTGKIEPHHLRWIEFLSHSVNVMEMMKMMQGAPKTETKPADGELTEPPNVPLPKLDTASEVKSFDEILNAAKNLEAGKPVELAITEEGLPKLLPVFIKPIEKMIEQLSPIPATSVKITPKNVPQKIPIQDQKASGEMSANVKAKVMIKEIFNRDFILKYVFLQLNPTTLKADISIDPPEIAGRNLQQIINDYLSKNTINQAIQIALQEQLNQGKIGVNLENVELSFTPENTLKVILSGKKK